MKVKTIVAFGLTLGLLTLVGFIGPSLIKASEVTPYPTIVQRLAERFHLNSDEVGQVFAEAREERGRLGQERFEERLEEAVAGGQITTEQKEALMAKKAEMQANREQLRESHRKEMEAWAKDNNIDLSLLGPIGRGGRGGGSGGRLCPNM